MKLLSTYIEIAFLFEMFIYLFWGEQDLQLDSLKIYLQATFADWTNFRKNETLRFLQLRSFFTAIFSLSAQTIVLKYEG